MGYAYSVYAVDLKKLAPIKGKATRERLFGELRAAHTDELREADEWFEDDIIRRGAPPRLRALWEVLEGRCSAKQFGFQYGYALELLCKHHGHRVDDVSLTWFADVLDPVLRRAKLPVTAKLLGAGRYPIAMPAPQDFPEIGSVGAADCKRHATALAKLPTSTDDDVAMVVREVQGWFAKAAAAKHGLVWFVY